jgi:hypothetical protein
MMNAMLETSGEIVPHSGYDRIDRAQKSGVGCSTLSMTTTSGGARSFSASAPVAPAPVRRVGIQW